MEVKDKRDQQEAFVVGVAVTFDDADQIWRGFVSDILELGGALPVFSLFLELHELIAYVLFDLLQRLGYIGVLLIFHSTWHSKGLDHVFNLLTKLIVFARASQIRILKHAQNLWRFDFSFMLCFQLQHLVKL